MQDLPYLVGISEVKGVDDVVTMATFTYEPFLGTELEMKKETKRHH